MASVFDEIERTDNGPAKAGETYFSYLNRSNRIEAQRVRALIEEWVSRYPESDQWSLIQRMRSTIDVAHVSAFFELTLHELLIRTGHKILKIEPTVIGSNHKPDFLVGLPDGSEFFLEAVTSMNQTPKEAAAHSRLNDAVRIIDEADARFHFLDLQIEGIPSLPVTLGQLRKSLAAWIEQLPKTAAVRDAAPFIYKEHGLTLTVGAFLRSIPLVTADRAIGVQSMEPYWGTPGDGIRESVQKKSSRYGKLDAPYVVAINAMSEFQNEEDACDAMFGSPCAIVRTYEDGRVETVSGRNPDGVWCGKNGPRKKMLSAIFSTERLIPWSVGHRRARIIRNPWASRPLPDILLGIDERNPVGGRLVFKQGRSLSEMLGLPTGWPESRDI